MNREITTLLPHPEALKQSVERLAAPFRRSKIDVVTAAIVIDLPDLGARHELKRSAFRLSRSLNFPDINRQARAGRPGII